MKSVISNSIPMWMSNDIWIRQDLLLHLGWDIHDKASVESLGNDEGNAILKFFFSILDVQYSHVINASLLLQ